MGHKSKKAREYININPRTHSYYSTVKHRAPSSIARVHTATIVL